MFSDQQIRSMVRMQTTNEQQSEGENLLDLSHQQLRRLKEIQLKQLRVERVDASYNYFKDFNHLNFKEVNDKLEVPIKWLDISFNFFTRIDESAESAHVLQFLKYLNISANRLESVDFSQLTVPLLEVLNLNNNQLQFFLDAPPALKVLTLDHNHLTSLAFSGGDNLNVLSAMNNKIKKIGVKLKNLLLLDLESNLVDDIETVKEFITHSKELLSINFRENPVSSINNYRVMLLERCDSITEIDDIIISPHIREGFKILKSQEKLDEMLDQANKKYVDRLSQKQKIKDELIKKMKEQQSLIEERFHSGIEEEKQQFEVLEKQAKIILGKNKLNVISEKDEFNKRLAEYSRQQQSIAQVSEQKINQLQNQHMKEYLQYLKKRPNHPTSSEPKQRRRKEENLSSTKIHNQFKKIVLFDTKCVETLLKGYHVNMIEL